MWALLGCGNARQSLTQRLMDLLERADGMQRYENWYLSMQKLTARSFVLRMRIREWREVSIYEVKHQLTLGLSDEGQYLANLQQGLLQSELLIWLPECRFCSDDGALLTCELDLASDLSKL